MRAIFSVASKLLGVYLSFVGMTYLISAFALGGGPAPVLLQALHAALAFAFAFVLVFRTDGLADRVGVRSDDAPAPIGGFESGVALRTGIVLIGLFVFVTHVGRALIVVSSQLRGVEFGGLGGAPVRIVIEAVPLALAVFLIVRADRVVDWITRKKTAAL